MISYRKVLEKIIYVHDENAKLRAIPVKRRDEPIYKEKVKKMEAKLLETFAVWPNNVDFLIKNPEDFAFLNSMKTDRKATFGPFDKISNAKEKRKLNRMFEENERKQRYEDER